MKHIQLLYRVKVEWKLLCSLNFALLILPLAFWKYKSRLQQFKCGSNAILAFISDNVCVISFFLFLITGSGFETLWNSAIINQIRTICLENYFDVCLNFINNFKFNAFLTISVQFLWNLLQYRKSPRNELIFIFHTFSSHFRHFRQICEVYQITAKRYTHSLILALITHLGVQRNNNQLNINYSNNRMFIVKLFAILR